VTEISKKELLERTGISYGQLYRWKRERLIPEEWFVKRSAITGQETYFPKEQILDRIEAILDLKEDHSLEEIRSILASEHSALLGRKRVLGMDVLPAGILDRIDCLRDKKEFRRGDIAVLVMLSELAAQRNLSQDQLDQLIERSLPLFDKDRSADTAVIVIEVAGALHLVLSRGVRLPLFDQGITPVCTTSLADLVAKIRIARFGDD